MCDKDRKIVQSMADAIADLPDEKKDYFVGFTEGMVAMAGQIRGEKQKNEGL